MTKEDYIFLNIIQVLTASVSLLSSSIMASSIAWFGSQGSTPYRRIILGLSISDIFQSLGFLTGPFSLPASKVSEEAANEVARCQANGFILQVGGLAVGMYTMFLCVYYLYKLKYRMSDNEFQFKIERKGHAFIAAFSLFLASLPLAMDLYHTNAFPRSFCIIAEVPTGCVDDPDVECDAANRVRADILQYTVIVGMIGAIFLGIIVTMGLLYHHVFVLNQNIEREFELSETSRTLRNQARMNNNDGVEEEGLPARSEIMQQQRQQQQQTAQDRVQQISRLYKREMTIQATLYVAAYILIYLPLSFSFAPGKISVLMSAISVSFIPLGGFLNILVYTRPKVANLRRILPECSRLRCFWLVLRAGGEIPDEIDLTVSYCEDCCWPPVWFLESEYEDTSPSIIPRQQPRRNARSFGIRLSRIEI